jgi:hypothetical protein
MLRSLTQLRLEDPCNFAFAGSEPLRFRLWDPLDIHTSDQENNIPISTVKAGSRLYYVSTRLLKTQNR